MDGDGAICLDKHDTEGYGEHSAFGEILQRDKDKRVQWKREGEREMGEEETQLVN